MVEKTYAITVDINIIVKSVRDHRSALTEDLKNTVKSVRDHRSAHIIE